jgi:hypothetical protein
MSLTEDAKSFVAELAQADYRRLMFLLQNFSNIKKSPIEKKDLYEYYDIISKKTLDLNSFDITNKIFQVQSRVEDILKLYDTDKSLLPMMIHENYIPVVNAQNTTLKNKLFNCQQCINSIINGDMIEKMMYNTQSWSLQPIHGLCSCYLPSYYSNTFPKLSHDRIKWTETLGNFSFQRANIKNIHGLASLFNTGYSYTVDDILLLSHIILYNLLDPTGNPQVGIEYMRNYNLVADDIDDLIKVNKLSDKYKKLYTSRQKTQLGRLLEGLKRLPNYPLDYHIGKAVKTIDSKKDTTDQSKTKKDTTEDETGDGDETDDEADEGGISLLS